MSNQGAARGKNPISVALGVLGASVALILGIVMLAQFAVGLYAQRSVLAGAAMDPQAVAERLKPVGEVKVDPNAPPPVATVAPAEPNPATQTAAAATSTQPVADKGKAVYDALCQACHAAGIAGAPKAGDKGLWAPRIAQGQDTLYTSAIKGKNAMPAKGGNTALSDEDVKAAVDYLVSLAK